MLLKFLTTLSLPIFTIAAPTSLPLTLINKCTVAIQPAFTGTDAPSGVGSIAAGQTSVVQISPGFVGQIYDSDSPDGSIRSLISMPTGYYTLLANIYGYTRTMGIVPSLSEFDGFCAAVASDNPYSNTFSSLANPPTLPTTIPTNPPASPIFQCGQGSVTFSIYYCGTRENVPGSGGNDPPPFQQIHPNGDTTKCMDVRGNVQANGTPVQIYDCNGTGAQNWLLNRENTKVQLGGTNFCLDAGSNPASGVGAKIWTCYDNLPAQAWYYTDDNRIAVTGQGQCLDLTNGNLVNANQLQTWQCTNGNTNQ